MAHELIHQWIGNDVAVNRWADIWHNEGWATYGAWLWADHRGTRSVEDAFNVAMARPASSSFWRLTLSDPGPLNLFHSAIYSRSAAMLYALREKIGDEAFLQLTRTVVSEYAGGNISTAEYEALAEQISGQDLDHFFEVWLHTPEKPTDW